MKTLDPTLKPPGRGRVALDESSIDFIGRDNATSMKNVAFIKKLIELQLRAAQVIARRMGLEIRTNVGWSPRPLRARRRGGR